MNTGVDLLILNIAVWIFCVTEGIPYAVMKSVSFMGAVVFSYFANKHWTFNDRSTHRSKRKFSHFILISLVGMLINVLTATVVVTQLKVPLNDLLQIRFLTDGVWINIGALAGSAVGMMWNFAGYKFFVFENPHDKG
jgi:putative flippase GtrA